MITRLSWGGCIPRATPGPKTGVVAPDGCPNFVGLVGAVRYVTTVTRLLSLLFVLLRDGAGVERERAWGDWPRRQSVSTWRKPWVWIADRQLSRIWMGSGADQGFGTNACCPTGTWGESVTTKLVYRYTQTLSQTNESSETETRIRRGG